jgi:ribosomal protein S12 methylthiotransferase accessory factor
VVILGGSLRAMPLLEATGRAERAAAAVGVTRVVDVTRLDRVGVPVACAVRPTAMPGSTCVAAGKGLTLEEARVGAMMEAVEQAWIEPGRSALASRRVKLVEILDGQSRHGAFLDLCPRPGALLDPSAPVVAVTARDLATGAPVLIPAELVFHPAPRHLGYQFFGTTSNGAASGMTVEEATLQALLEVLERDVASFHNLRDRSVRIADHGLPAPIAALAPALAEAHLRLVIRALPNEHDLPCFVAVIVDLDAPQLSLRGDGLHLRRDLAVQRAVLEALQCRLTLIHGGRDDLDHFVIRQRRVDPETRARENQELLTRLELGEARPFDGVPEHPPGETIEETLRLLVADLARRGFPQVLQVVLTPPEDAAPVVRVIVPRLECWLPDVPRVGPRLHRLMRSRS